MSEEALQMMQENMAAMDAGEEMPHTGDPEDAAVEESIDPVTEPDPEPNAEPEEDIAKKDGYMSKEDWIASGKDPEQYMTQEDFERVGQLRDDKSVTRQQLSKEYVQTQAMLKEVMKNQQKMLTDAEERVRAETLASIEKQQKEAIEDGETEKAIELEREKLKHTEKPDDTPDDTPQIEAGVQDWVDKNSSWYSVDQSATNLMNIELKKAQDKGLSFSEGSAQAEAKVRKHFSYYFDDEQPEEKPAPRRPSAVSERSRRKPEASKSKTFNDLPAEMRSMAKKVAKQSGMTEAEYMESYTA